MTVKVSLLAIVFAGSFTTLVESQPLRSAGWTEVPLLELAKQGDAFFEQGKWGEAGYVYEELLRRFEQAGNVEGIARALLDQSRVFSALGRTVDGEAGLKRVLSLLPSVPEARRGDIEAAARERLGALCFTTGRLEEGTAEFRKAQELWRRTGQPAKEVEVLRGLAHALRGSGDLDQSLAVYHEAAEIQRRLPADPQAEGDLLVVKAMVDLEVGKFQDALTGLYKAEDLYRQGGNPQKMEVIRALMTLTEYSAGREEEALSGSQGVIAANRLEDASIIAQSFKALELIRLVEEDRFEKAIEVGQQLLSYWEQDDQTLEGIIHFLLGMCYQELGQGEKALAELAQASAAFQAAGVDGPADSMVGLVSIFSQIFVEAGAESPQNTWQEFSRMKTLIDLTEKNLQERLRTLEDSERKGSFRDELDLRRLKFLSHFGHLDQESSFQDLDEMVSLLEQQGQDLTLGELKTGFFAQFFEIYSSAVEFSAWMGRSEAAFNYAEMARARAFIDQIGNQRIAAERGANPEIVREERRLRVQLSRLRDALRAERKKPLAEQSSELIENFQTTLEETEKDYEELRLKLAVTSPEYAALVGLKALKLSEIQQQVLDSRTTLVEYFLPESPGIPGRQDQIFAWVVERDRFTMLSLPVSAGDLKNRVALFRNLIESLQPVEAQAAELYRDLFAPLAAQVRHRNLVIVPHGVLHFLPFAALWDGNRYLGDAKALSYAPSATALKFAREKKAKPAGPLLAAGNPDGSLPHAAREAEAVARLFHTKPLLGAAATEKALLARAGQAGILHLATHADLNPVNPLFTSIQLAPDSEHDGSLEMHEVYGLDLSKTGLVVLSGCKTQIGKLSRGDEIEGLTRAFLYAGTPAVMSSLWKVDDESTAFFMERFYRQLRKKKGRAEALQAAQAETRVRFPHPYDWAAFVLTGDRR